VESLACVVFTYGLKEKHTLTIAQAQSLSFDSVNEHLSIPDSTWVYLTANPSG